MTNLDSILKEASSIVISNFNFDIEKSKLKTYSPKNWEKFCDINNFDANSFGIYIPESYLAYVRLDSSFLISNIFHELYGHGLFVEHSQIGKELTKIIQNNGDDNNFMFNEINLEKQNFGITKHNIHNYEGFAIWLENLLCEETGNKSIFKNKKKYIHNDYLELLDFFKQAEKNLTRFGLISQMGFPKYYDDNKIIEIVKKFYGSNINQVDFVLLRGSQKPESDIDLFVVSDNYSHNFLNGWLDIYEVNRIDFENWSKNLDISITDAMFSGKLIYGDQNYFEQNKQKILNQPITNEVIKYNISEIERLKKYETTKKNEEFSVKKYIDSFSKNLEQLILGNKPLTLSNLQQLYKK
ncbi:MAG: nucleotidyltransferase domain-containing protein [Candidatus Nanoarchaeia archaeon]|nr:nucleotidyltransferase domain-containing protein [Candidatus Nanoarchaeia archaeon]